MAGSGSNALRIVLRELGWSRKRLVAELRRQAASTGETLPGTESLIALASRWVNNHQQPSDFYRELLARTLGRPRAELFSDEATRLELAAEAEPWLLARALEASAVGQAALDALEQPVGEFARSYPSTAPTVLARPVLEHLRDVTRLLDGPLPVARRQRLVLVAGTWQGWPAAWRSTSAMRQRPWPTSRWPYRPPTMLARPTWRRGRWRHTASSRPTPATRLQHSGSCRRRRTAPVATSATAGSHGWRLWRPERRRGSGTPPGAWLPSRIPIA